ncbi:hypothetical protein O3P69_013981 [Scylla paramamosain]|uniref:Tricalbin-1 n=1 Tax=Scylla paramamosain TaxID=85552 RepID=A0AAW0SQT5_SCYPA
MRLQLKEGGSRPWPEECCGSETDQLPEDNASASTTTSTIAAAAAAAAATLHSPQQHHHQYLAEHHHSLYPGLPATLSGEPRPSQLLEDDLKEVLARGSKSGVGVLLPLVGVVVGAWALGAWGASWAWLVISVAFTWALVTGALQRAAQDAARHESLRLSRRRALQADESCEWLNLLVNRWWVFSSASIFARVKAALDPRLAEAKPAFLETISLKQLSLGERTPVLRSVRAWDVTTTTDPSSPRRPHCPTRPPPGLAHAPTHTIALVCDLALDSDSFSAVLSARIGGKGMGVELDVGVEKLAVLGRVVVTATLDMEAPFPHVSRLSLSFTEKPQVWFSVRILKAVQMMELPVLKTWLHSLVMDALSTAWVDPGQLEINIHTSDIIVPETRAGDTLAQGVLTVILWTLKGTSGLDEDKWVVVYVDGQQHVTPSITSQRWQEACSFLVSSSPGNHNLVLKVKTKRLITTTLTQFDLPLSQYGLENCKVAETVLQKKGKVIGASIPPIHLRLQYTPLTPITLEAPMPPPLTDHQEGAGVLYIMVHGADNITTPTSENLPSPYCLIFNNRKKVKMTHYVSECGSPRWECGVEVLVREVCAVTLAMAVCSLPRTATLQDTELLGLATVSLATVKLPMVRRPLPLTRSLPTPGTTPTSSSPMGTVTVTVVFRSIPSVAGCNISSAPDSVLERAGQAILGSVAPGQTSGLGTPVGTLRRPSLTGLGDDEDGISKKRPNAPWYSQASRRWGTQAGTQDIGDILASGLGLMELTIIRARDLVAKDLNGYSDPYCVVKVNGEVKYRTRVKKKTLNPEWEETLMTHLPKAPDHLSITLWDHDAFGRDFLGSVSLGEEEVRGMSIGDAPVWCLLEGTKSGHLEVRIKVISDDYEIKAADGPLAAGVPLGAGSTEGKVVMVGTEGDPDNSEGVASQESVDEPESPILSSDLQDSQNGETPPLTNGRRASESSILDNQREEPPIHTNLRGTMSGSATPASSSPVHAPVQSRRSGAKIIASALSMARARSHEASPAHSPKSTKAIPKISLTEHHSEDDYGGGSSSSPEHHHRHRHHHKSKKSSDGGLRAVREKVCRGLAHPLRRFRSEANVRGEQQQQEEEEEEEEGCQELQDSPHHPHHHPRLQLSLSVGVPVRVGVGGGESDASELLGGDAPLSHAKSQPNLLLEAARRKTQGQQLHL